MSSSNSKPMLPATPEAMAVEAGLSLVKETIQCFTDYMKCKEHEITARADIRAKLTINLARIESQKEVYKYALESSFNERKMLYELVNSSLQHYLDTNDHHMVEMSYKYLLSFYETSLNVLPIFGER